MLKMCETCLSGFDSIQGKNRFCSRDCLYESMRTRKVCDWCGNRLIKPNSKTIKYCSHECAVRAKTKGPEWTKRRYLNWYYQREYGITLEQYNALLEKQEGRCAICQLMPDIRLAVDHNHITGDVRGLLCQKCNQGIGLLNDDPVLLSRAVEYLTLPSGG